MMTRALASFVQLLRQSKVHQGGAATDGELLDCFIRRRDDDAFEMLVRRHGPMVLGVCRRVLHNEADVEDCFQATFLVLVRRAASLRRRTLVGNWLYGVARRTALKARTMRNLRHKKEQEAATERAGRCADHDRDLHELLDRELEALPDKYRAAIVLCDLEGLTIAAAAKQVGCAQGTLNTRLVRGRAMLAKRLTRRGLTLGTGVVTAALAQNAASAAMPSPLVTSTVKAAGLFAAGQVASGVIGAKVAALTEGVLKTMLLTKFKNLAIVLLLASSIVGTGTIVVVSQNVAAQPEQKPATGPGSQPSPDDPGDSKPAPVEKQVGTDAYGDPLPPGALARLGTVRFRAGSGVSFLAYTADGKTIAYDGHGSDDAIRMVEARTGKELRSFQLNVKPLVPLGRPELSPDGKMLAVACSNPSEWNDPKKIQGVIAFWDTATGQELKRIDCGGIPGSALAFSPDGKLLAADGQVWDVATGKKLRGLFGEVPAFSADGKWLALASGLSSREKSVSLYDTAGWNKVRDMDADPPGKMAGQSRPALTFSPDGKWLAAVTSDGGVRIWETATGKMVDFLSAQNGDSCSLSISADSKLLAVASCYGPLNRTMIWDLATRKPLHELDAARVVAFTPPGVTPILLATGGGPAASSTQGGAPAVRFWDPTTGKEVSINNAPYGAVQLTRWLPDGKVLAVYPAEKCYRLWDGRSRQAVGQGLYRRQANCLLCRVL